ncbi:MAG: hypothetical protein JJU24_09095, partial [Natronohydrobacter sp.]|nr:hypothetical protein [Natronohydrobacter sp.]
MKDNSSALNGRNNSSWRKRQVWQGCIRKSPEGNKSKAGAFKSPPPPRIKQFYEKREKKNP